MCVCVCVCVCGGGGGGGLEDPSPLHRVEAPLLAPRLRATTTGEVARRARGIRIIRHRAVGAPAGSASPRGAGSALPRGAGLCFFLQAQPGPGGQAGFLAGAALQKLEPNW